MKRLGRFAISVAIVAWYLCVRAVVFRISSDGILEYNFYFWWSSYMALPITALSLGAGFALFLAGKWIWRGSI